MQLDDGFGNGQPHSESAVGTSTHVFRLAEAFENVRKELRLDAFTIVHNPYLDMRIHTLQDNLNAATLGRELDRIRQEIPCDLLQPLEVSRYGTGMGIQNGLDSD